MPDKTHLEGGLKIGPPLAEYEKENFSHSQHTSEFSEAAAGSRFAGPAALLRKPTSSCYRIGAGSCCAPLLRTIASCFFQSSQSIACSARSVRRRPPRLQVGNCVGSILITVVVCGPSCLPCMSSVNGHRDGPLQIAILVTVAAFGPEWKVERSGGRVECGVEADSSDSPTRRPERSLGVAGGHRSVSD